MRATALLGAALAATLALSCAAPAARPPPAAPAAAAPAPAPAPPGRYGVEPEVTPSPVEAVALDLVRARLAGTRGRPRVSGALVLAARELARAAADGEGDPLSGGRLRAALARAHAWDPSPGAALVEAPPGQAGAALARALPRTGATHVGAGAVERAGRCYLVVLAADRKAALSPFPRDVAPGARAVLSGKLSAGLTRPRVFVALPGGAVREAAAADARGFRAPLEFAAPGRHLVELVADGDGGPEVVALLAVSVGGAPLEGPPAAAEDGSADGPAAEAAVVRAVNAARGRQGLPALVPSEEVAAVARRHSAAMAAAGKVAHVLPGSGDAGARLRRAAVPYRRAFENVARAATPLRAHRAAEESPAHLANLLQPGATRIGVGVARGALPSGDEAIYVTEIFLEPADDGAGSPLVPEARVREALWQERQRRSLAPLTADAALDDLAREAAAAMRARDEPEAPDLGDRALALRRGLAAVDVFVASAPAEAARSPNLADARFRRVGVGVTIGDSRRFGAGRYWIAVVYTD
jgi:uncharacterized protein YkwD